MNGQWLGTRAIRVNWANQKSAPTKPVTVPELDYYTVLMQASPTNTTVYIGNIGPDTPEPELRSIFVRYGFIEELRVHPDKGYGFVRFQSHDVAARAIVGAHGTTIGSRQIRCSWGKERIPTPGQQPSQSQTPPQPPAPPAWPYGVPPGMPMPPYGFPPYFMPFYPPMPHVGAYSTWPGWPPAASTSPSAGDSASVDGEDSNK